MADVVRLGELLPRLRCPRSGSGLVREGDALRSVEGEHRYEVADGAPRLCVPPSRLTVDLPWYEPWDELGSIPLDKPVPAPAPDLPYHLDPYLASIPGEEGRGRWIVEIGCGERQCEPYFARRGFRYVGTDVERRGLGPHVYADAHNLPFADESFDLYTSMAVYEHLASPLVAACEAHRILRPGGVFFGTAAFVYGFHDHASFHHMTHAALLWNFRTAGFRVERIWPDWYYTQSIPEMAFPDKPGIPFRRAAELLLKGLDRSYVFTSSAARKVMRREPFDPTTRDVHTAASLSWVARKLEA